MLLGMPELVKGIASSNASSGLLDSKYFDIRGSIVSRKFLTGNVTRVFHSGCNVAIVAILIAITIVFPVPASPLIF